MTFKRLLDVIREHELNKATKKVHKHQGRAQQIKKEIEDETALALKDYLDYKLGFKKPKKGFWLSEVRFNQIERYGFDRRAFPLMFKD